MNLVSGVIMGNVRGVSYDDVESITLPNYKNRVFNIMWESVCITYAYMHVKVTLRNIVEPHVFLFSSERSCLQILVGLVARRSWKS